MFFALKNKINCQREMVIRRGNVREFWINWNVAILFILKYFFLHFITARIRRMGKVIVSVCLSVHTWGPPSYNTSTGPMSFPGVPHLHPIILPLVPCPFQGVPQWLVPGPFQRVPQSWMGGTPARDGTLRPGQDGRVPHDGVPYQSGMGYPPARSG